MVWDDAGYSTILYSTGFRGKFQLDLAPEPGEGIPEIDTASVSSEDVAPPCDDHELDEHGQQVPADVVVGQGQRAFVGMRVRRRGHAQRGVGGTIIKCVEKDRLCCVRWDQEHDGQGAGFEMLSAGYFGAFHLGACCDDHIAASHLHLAPGTKLKSRCHSFASMVSSKPAVCFEDVRSKVYFAYV